MTPPPHEMMAMRCVRLNAVVGNSPLNLDESPSGLGNVMRTFDAISRARALLFRKLANVSDHVTWLNVVLNLDEFSEMAWLDLGDGYLKKCSKRRYEMFFGFRKSSFGRRRSCGVGYKLQIILVVSSAASN
jgi:hypothetical protein